MSIHQVTDSLVLKDAEDYSTFQEAGYYSASTAATEVLYLCNLLDQMGFAQQEPTPLYEDYTVCALNGETTSLVVVSALSTLTSGSTCA